MAKSLPANSVWVIATNLDYLDTLRLCARDKRFLEICKDPYFWKYKIETEYPDEVIPKDMDPKSAYIMFEAQYLLDEAETYKYDAYTKDPEYIKLKEEENKLSKTYDNLEEKLENTKKSDKQKVRTQMEKIARQLIDIQNAGIKMRMSYGEKIDKLRKRASRLQTILESRKPTDKEYRYLSIPVNFDKLGDLANVIKTEDTDILKEYLYDKFRISGIKAGDLIGFRGYITKKDSTPACVIYFYKLPGKGLKFDWKYINADRFDEFPLKELPKALVSDMKAKNWSLQELKDKYNLPFKIPKVDESRKRSPLGYTREQFEEELEEVEPSSEDEE